MASHILQILRQGVWAALTGGWYHDPEDSQFNNICHLYLWVFLLLLPLAMHLGLPATRLTLCLYCISTTMLFTVIKFVSFRLHLMFDNGTVVHHKKHSKKAKNAKDVGNSNISSNHTDPSKNVELDIDEVTQSHQESNTTTSPDSLVIEAVNHNEGLKDLIKDHFPEKSRLSENLEEKSNPAGENGQPCCQVTENGKAIYKVIHTSQQDTSVLQVICGLEASLQDDAHIHIQNSEHRRSCCQKGGHQFEIQCESVNLSVASITHDTESKSETETVSENQGLFSDDPDEESLQKQVSSKPAKQAVSRTETLSHEAENSSYVSSEYKFPKKQFYKFSIFPGKWIKVWCDRLTFLALFDKTENIGENIIAILLAICVSFFGFLLLHQGLFKDIWIFQFCVVISSCQFCLLKSVQPDPASPVHGYNQIITYSRPVYFCILCSVILLLNAGSEVKDLHLHTLYGFHFLSPECFQSVRDQLIVLVSLFPLISLLGLFPQVNTFCVYFLEQIDILVFGGSAKDGFLSALYSLFRSTVIAALLFIVCYQSLKEPWDIRHIPPPFSIFCGLLISLSYHLSRQSSDPFILISLVKCNIFRRLFCENVKSIPTQQEDPLPQKIKLLVKEILISDLIVCTVIAILTFAVSASTVFLSLRPFLSIVLLVLTLMVGVLAHYVIPQLRKHHPWLWISQPVLQNREYKQREVLGAAQLMWFEKCYVWIVCLEKYVLYPSIILSAATIEAFSVSKHSRFGKKLDSLLISIAGLKLLRSCFCSPIHQYLVFGFTVLFFLFDYHIISESFLLDFYFITILFYKFLELLNKMNYVLAYIAPWQIAWGSSFHVFAQLFAIPHSAMLFIQTVATSVLSMPLSPFLGSVIFVASYARPIKFWEKKNSTVRLDNLNTRLQQQIEKDPGNDDNNLNSIFYEHLSRSLQHSLCGDLMLGRWGNYSAGDCFILVSDYLNALVHLVEIGNGFVTFQLRGLEFKGTYCHQREVEAITEGYDINQGCCCFQPGHLPHILSCNSAFNLRWLTWEVVRGQYILEGYNVIYSNASSLFQVFDLRKILIRYYVKSIIYFATCSPKLLHWLSDQSMQKALQSFTKWDHVENDHTMFNINIDEDYIPCLQGITRASFCSVYLDWIQYCTKQNSKKVDCDEDSFLVTISFGLCILGRRLLAAATHHLSFSLDSFLHGLHTLFKGHYRISKEEEWVFADMDLLHTVISPAIRMSLKLHQSQFASPDEYEDHPALFDAIKVFEEKVVICDEKDPAWRAAVLSNKEELLTLRHVVDEGNDDYSVIMLQKSYLSFKVIKVNKECVRGLWAGQQQELIFLRNRDHERGSIQNNKHVLRNLINSSCDQPLGYPIYVSPITISYLGMHEQLNTLLAGPVDVGHITTLFQTKWRVMRKENNRSNDNVGNAEESDCDRSLSSATSSSESNGSKSLRNSQNVCNENQEVKCLEIKSLQPIGKRKLKSKSAHTHSSLNQISAHSGANKEKRHACCDATDDYRLTKRLSSSQHCVPDCTPSPFSHANKNINEQTQELQQSGYTSSTNSTLSLLFGKKGFSSALVLSGLSAADGDNTADTLSSGSVNLVVCPLSKTQNQTERFYETFESAEIAEASQMSEQEHQGGAANTPSLETSTVSH
ncbi:pecanex-like protein 2 [Aquarana catesbeiana]|uniref:pecanex-like protein 2 n=1 Tax=Aquarana catesbeiana TaxID=8400 RepID=UPI003CC967F7